MPPQWLREEPRVGNAWPLTSIAFAKIEARLLCWKVIPFRSVGVSLLVSLHSFFFSFGPIKDFGVKYSLTATDSSVVCLFVCLFVANFLLLYPRFRICEIFLMWPNSTTSHRFFRWFVLACAFSCSCFSIGVCCFFCV